MEIGTDFYVVVSGNGNVWERSHDFENDGDYFDLNLSRITKDNLISLDDAIEFKEELDREIGSTNNITFL